MRLQLGLWRRRHGGIVLRKQLPAAPAEQSDSLVLARHVLRQRLSARFNCERVEHAEVGDSEAQHDDVGQWSPNVALKFELAMR